MNTQLNSNAGSGCPATTCSACGVDVSGINAERAETRGLRKAWVELDNKRQELETTIAVYQDTIAKARYNHRYEREKMARVIRRLVRYADRVAERHPKAVTTHGQNARVAGGIWLAEFDRPTAEVRHGAKDADID